MVLYPFCSNYSRKVHRWITACKKAEFKKKKAKQKLTSVMSVFIFNIYVLEEKKGRHLFIRVWNNKLVWQVGELCTVLCFCLTYIVPDKVSSRKCRKSWNSCCTGATEHLIKTRSLAISNKHIAIFIRWFAPCGKLLTHSTIITNFLRTNRAGETLALFQEWFLSNLKATLDEPGTHKFLQALNMPK